MVVRSPARRARAGTEPADAVAPATWRRSRSHPGCLDTWCLPRSHWRWAGRATRKRARQLARANHGSKPSAEIKVDAVRQAVAFSQQTNSRGVAKVVIIYPAEQMNMVSANTLLKTLEEPPGTARFVLATGHPDRLLPTVRSRCQSVPLAVPVVAGGGVGMAGVAGQGIQAPDVMLAACGGQVLAALNLITQGVDARIWQQNSAVGGDRHAVRVGVLADVSVVQTLLKLCSDAQRAHAACGREPVYFAPGTVPNTCDPMRSTAWAVAELRKVMRHADHPLNAGLQIEALVQRGRVAIAPLRVNR